MTTKQIMTFKELSEVAIGAAMWVTCSPHEWVWTHEQQIAMAHFTLEAAKRLSLWQWTIDMELTVNREAAESPKWAVLDVDGEVLGRGETPEDAIIAAQLKVQPDANVVHLAK